MKRVDSYEFKVVTESNRYLAVNYITKIYTTPDQQAQYPDLIQLIGERFNLNHL